MDISYGERPTETVSAGEQLRISNVTVVNTILIRWVCLHEARDKKPDPQRSSPIRVRTLPHSLHIILLSPNRLAFQS